MVRSRFWYLLFVIVLSTSRAFADGSSGSGGVSLANGSPITQDFNSLSSSASPSNVLPTGWYLTEIGTGAAADGSYVVGTGSSNTGGAYSFGASGSSERSLGSVASGTAAPIHFGAKFTNNASGPITALAISFTGEMWRRGPSTETDSLTFSYSTAATGLNTGSFFTFPALNFNSPGNACASVAGATNGNSASCRVSITATVTGLSVSPGGTIWIRWTDNDTAGSDDGLAIDDVSVSASIGAVATPPTATGSANPNPVSPGQQTTLSGNISPGQNPASQSLAVSCDLSGIAGSSTQSLPVTGNSFSYTASVGANVALGVYALPCKVNDDQSRSSNFSIGLTLVAGSPPPPACGVERWPVKTGTDADSGLVNLNSVTPTTIENLVALAEPLNKPQNNRVPPTETTVFSLNGTLTQYKLEDDSDYHVVLSDAAGRTMIAEIPLPGCVGSGSPFAPGIANARSEFNARLTATTSFKTANIPVQIKGVGFFDFIHGQTGVAPNGIELHPVLDIVFNPAAITPPTVVSLAPVASSGSSQTLTTVFNATGGYQTLDVVNVLINNVLDGRQACYLAYSRSSNVLYIVPDNGDGSQITGKVMDGTGIVFNSQCTVALAGSSATGSGNTLTLALSITFASSFAGNKVVYAAARDTAQNNSGWQTLGVHGVPPLPSTFPNPLGMSPSSGSSLSSTIAFSYQDQIDATNLQTVWTLINTAIDGRNACYVAYYRPGNQLYLYPDNGDGSQATSIVLTGNNTISNSQCTISAQGSNVETIGNTLTVTLPVTFKAAFAGFKGVWQAAQTLGGAQTSPWQALGAWSVPAN